MKEHEWDQCKDSTAMLAHIGGKMGERKSRLFMAACCRRHWHRFEPLSRQVVEAVEHYVDELIDAETAGAVWFELLFCGTDRGQSFWDAGWGAFPALLTGSRLISPGIPWNPLEGRLLWPISHSDDRDEYRSHQDFVRWCCVSMGYEHPREAVYPRAPVPPPRTGKPTFWDKVKHWWHRPPPRFFSYEELAHQADLLRDVLGNPKRKIRFEQDWRDWHGGTVEDMARRIYDERAFADLPILGDALEEAGCTSSDILAHCRQPAPHARGCWVLDGLLQLPAGRDCSDLDNLERLPPMRVSVKP